MTFVNAIRVALGSEAHRRIHQQRVTAQALRALDDHILRDIGVLDHEMRATARGPRSLARNRY